MFNLQRAGDVATKAPIKALIYGDSGSGKTTLAVTAPKPLVLLTERQAIPSINASNPDAVIIECASADDLRKVISAIRDGDKQLAQFETLVIDSLTESQRLIKDDILKKGRRDQMQMQDWGKLADGTRGLIRSLRDLPINVVCTALMEHETEESTGKRFVNPIFEGRKTNKEIAQWFSFIGCLYRKDTKAEDGKRIAQRHLMLDGSDTVLCKTIPPLDGLITDPNLTTLFNKVHSHQKS